MNNRNEAQTDSSNALSKLPDEMLVHIFSFFSYKELGVVKQVNKQFNNIGNTLTNTLPALDGLRGSKLWKYLPDIVDNKDIFNYFQEKAPILESMNEGHDEQDPLTVQSISNIFSERRQELPPYGLKVEENYIVSKAKFILDKIGGRTFIDKCENVLDYFDFPLQSQIGRKALHAYIKLEQIFAAIHLFLLNFPLDEYAGYQKVINNICNPKLNLWLTGQGLLFLNEFFTTKTNPFHLIETLLQTSIDLHTQDPQSEQIAFIDNLLIKMTENDWLTFLAKKEHETSRAQILMSANQSKHPINTQLTEKVLLEIGNAINQDKPAKHMKIT